MLALSDNGSVFIAPAPQSSQEGKQKPDRTTEEELNLRIRSWVTVWDEKRTEVLIRVPYDAESPHTKSERWPWIDSQNRSEKPQTFEVVPQTFSPDGRLAVTLQGDLSFTGRLLLRAMVESVNGTCSLSRNQCPNYDTSDSEASHLGDGVRVGGVTLLDADILWGDDAAWTGAAEDDDEDDDANGDSIPSSVRDLVQLENSRISDSSKTSSWDASATAAAAAAAAWQEGLDAVSGAASAAWSWGAGGRGGGGEGAQVGGARRHHLTLAGFAADPWEFAVEVAVLPAFDTTQRFVCSGPGTAAVSALAALACFWALRSARRRVVGVSLWRKKRLAHTPADDAHHLRDSSAATSAANSTAATSATRSTATSTGTSAPQTTTTSLRTPVVATAASLVARGVRVAVTVALWMAATLLVLSSLSSSSPLHRSGGFGGVLEQWVWGGGTGGGGGVGGQCPPVNHRRAFYVNGWQSWSFTGTLVGAEQVPPYRVGTILNDGFHSGGSAPPEVHGHPRPSQGSPNAAPTAPRRAGKVCEPSVDERQRFFGLFSGGAAAAAAVDMAMGFRVSHWFGVVAAPKRPRSSSFSSSSSSLRSYEGVVAGFVGQRRTLGTIATNAAADRLVAFADTDQVELDGRGGGRSKLVTDWLSVELHPSLSPDEPMAGFLDFAAKAHGLNFNLDPEPEPTATAPPVASSTAAAESKPTAPPALSSLQPDRHPHLRALVYAVDEEHSASSSSSSSSPQPPAAASSSSSSSLAAPAPARPRFPLSGWCSWYHFYEHVSETSVRENMNSIASTSEVVSAVEAHDDDDDDHESNATVDDEKDGAHTHHHAKKKKNNKKNRQRKTSDNDDDATVLLPLDLVQIDDGYQNAWGDWQALKKGVTKNKNKNQQQPPAASPEQGKTVSGEEAATSNTGRPATDPTTAVMPTPLDVVHDERGGRGGDGEGGEAYPHHRPHTLTHSVAKQAKKAGESLVHSYIDKAAGAGVTAAGAAAVLGAADAVTETVAGLALEGGFVNMATLARDIKDRSFEAGVWLAPGAMDKHSELAKNHPDWILRDAKGTPINAGFCGKFYLAIDVTIPEALEHVRSSISAAVHEWGFRYLKLDFLHSSLVSTAVRHNPHLTRAEVFALFMDTIRSAAGPDVFILGCGLPVGPGLGQVQAARVSADAGPQWHPNLNDKHNIPGARNMMRNSVTRLALHRRAWLNDPDCLLLRDTTGLSLAEVRSIASVVGLLGGPTIISDDIPALSEERRAIGAALLPIAASGPRAKALDLLEREEPSALVRRFDASSAFRAITLSRGAVAGSGPVFSSSGGSGGGSSSGAGLGAQGGGARGEWDVAVVLNWHWRPRAKAVTLTVDVPANALLRSLHGDDGRGGGEDDDDDLPPMVEFHVFEFWSGTYERVRGYAAAHPVNRGSEAGDFTGAGDRRAESAKKNSRALSSVVKATLELGSRGPLPPHGSLLYAVRPVLLASPQHPPEAAGAPPLVLEPQFLGSDFHFSCGLEVSEFTWTRKSPATLRPHNATAPLSTSGADAMKDTSNHHGGDSRNLLEMTLAVGREVKNSHVWVYLPFQVDGERTGSFSIQQLSQSLDVSGSAFGGNFTTDSHEGAELVTNQTEHPNSCCVWKVPVSFPVEGGHLQMVW